MSLCSLPFMPSVVMLNVIMLIVVTPYTFHKICGMLKWSIPRWPDWIKFCHLRKFFKYQTYFGGAKYAAKNVIFGMISFVLHFHQNNQFQSKVCWVDFKVLNIVWFRSFGLSCWAVMKIFCHFLARWLFWILFSNILRAFSNHLVTLNTKYLLSFS